MESSGEISKEISVIEEKKLPKYIEEYTIDNILDSLDKPDLFLKAKKIMFIRSFLRCLKEKIAKIKDLDLEKGPNRGTYDIRIRNSGTIEFTLENINFLEDKEKNRNIFLISKRLCKTILDENNMMLILFKKEYNGYITIKLKKKDHDEKIMKEDNINNLNDYL